MNSHKNKFKDSNIKDIEIGEGNKVKDKVLNCTILDNEVGPWKLSLFVVFVSCMMLLIFSRAGGEVIVFSIALTLIYLILTKVTSSIKVVLDKNTGLITVIESKVAGKERRKIEEYKISDIVRTESKEFYISNKNMITYRTIVFAIMNSGESVEVARIDGAIIEKEDEKIKKEEARQFKERVERFIFEN